MKPHDTILEPGRFYHIYNRGINGTNLFYEERNYGYFLQKYAYYMCDVVDTYAYCLLKNHFHLLIRVKEDLPAPSSLEDLTGLFTNKGWLQTVLLFYHSNLTTCHH